MALMQRSMTSDIYVQAGKRRSGNMVTLPITPQILSILSIAKSGYNFILISIAITNKDLSKQ